MDNNKINEQFFIWDKNLNNERSWSHQLKYISHLIDEYDNIYMYQIRMICDIEQFIVIQHSILENTWLSNLENFAI